MTLLERIRGWRPSDTFWTGVAQAFIGLFFIGAGVYKLENYLVIGDQKLSTHFQYWIDNRWAAQWYVDFLAPWVFDTFWEKVLEVSVIALQFTGGLLLVTGRWTRLAGALIFFIQLNVFLGTIGHTHFNEFVGISLWVGLFYLFEPRGEGRRSTAVWILFTLAFMGLLWLRSWNRFEAGDLWLSEMEWHRRHFAEYVMSSFPLWKDMVLAFASTSVGAIFWAGVWWVEVALPALLLIPVRAVGLVAGNVLLLIALIRIITWLNVYTSQGAFWLLAIFVWVTVADRRRQRRLKRRAA